MKNVKSLPYLLMGFMMIVFGLNKYLGFIAVAPPSDPTAQSFIGTMFTSYLFQVVALAEIIGGILLFIPKTRFLGWLLLAPVIFNIAMFHFAHDFVGNGIWLVPIALFIVIGIFQKNQVMSIVKIQPS